MRIWVTGGAGCVGSHLVEMLLNAGHRVDALDDLSTGRFSHLTDARRREGFGFHQVDVRGDELIGLAVRQRPDVIVHLAGNPFRPGGFADPRAEASLSVLSILNVLAAAQAVDGAVVGVVHATPDAVDAPSTPAEVSAWTIVDHLRIAHEVSGVLTTCVAISNVYGPRQRIVGGGPLVASMVAAIAGGGSVVIDHGDHTRDLLFVDDAVDALLRCVERMPGGVIPVGSGTVTRPSAVADLLARVAGVDVSKVEGPERPGDRDRPAWPLDQASERLGWRPWTTLEDGLRRCWRAATDAMTQGAPVSG